MNAAQRDRASYFVHLLLHLLRGTARFAFFLWALHALLFFIFSVLPQSSLSLLGWAAADTQFAERVNRDLGIDGPWHERYWQHLSQLLRGNLGTTARGGYPVGPTLLSGLTQSLPIIGAGACGIFMGFATAVIFSIPARRPSSSWRPRTPATALLLPPFVVAAAVYAVYQRMVFSSGSINVVWFWTSVLVASATFPYLVTFAATRRVCAEVAQSNYLMVYFAFGANEWQARRYVLPNILRSLRPQLIRVVVLSITSTGFVEVLWGIPGWLRLGLIAYRDSDYPLMLAFALSIGACVYLTTEAARWRH